MAEFRDALRMLRGETGTTQMELANALHVNYSTVSRWELGKSCPNRSITAVLMQFARERGVSRKCMETLESSLSKVAKVKLDQWSGRRARPGSEGSARTSDDALDERVINTLLRTDYEAIATIDAVTGEAHPFSHGHLDEVMKEQKTLGDNVAGVEAYLRKYCADEDVERVIKETSLPYVIEQLAKKPSVTTCYSLRQKGDIIHKRVLYTYLDGDSSTILCAMRDITETYREQSARREKLEQALSNARELGAERDRLSAQLELSSACIEKTGLSIGNYDLKTKTYHHNNDILFALGYGETIQGVPDRFIFDGIVAPESKEDFYLFYEKLREGKPRSVTCALKAPGGAFKWYRMEATLVSGEGGEPEQAVIIYQDVTELREQAAVYAKWKNSLLQKGEDAFTLFRCNLSRSASFDSMEGALLKIEFSPEQSSFNGRTQEYASRFVHREDLENYIAFLNSERLMEDYRLGVRTESMNYRENIAENEYRWLKVTVEMVQYPGSEDIEAFLMYELSADVRTAQKKQDSAQSILEDSAFTEKLNILLSQEPELLLEAMAAQLRKSRK